MLLPSLLESRYLGRSIWEDASYWDSFGADAVVRMLAGGDLLDGKRLPVLTLLALVGVVAAAVRRPAKPDYVARRARCTGFGAALLLYFGRPFWGALTTLLPFSGSLPLHRFYLREFSTAACFSLRWGWARPGEALKWERTARVPRPRCTITLLLFGAGAVVGGLLGLDDARERTASADDLAWNGGDLAPVLDRFVALDRESPGWRLRRRQLELGPRLRFLGRRAHVWRTGAAAAYPPSATCSTP